MTPNADGSQPPDPPSRLSRRSLLWSAGGLTLAGVAAACDSKKGQRSLPVAPRQPHLVRVVTVFTPVDSGMLPSLTPEFTSGSGYQVKLDAADDVFGPALTGDADLLICHYGHVGLPGRLPGQPRAITYGSGNAPGFTPGHPPSGYGPGHPPPGYGPGHPPPNGPAAAATATGTAARQRYNVERFVREGYGLWPRAVFGNQAVVLGPAGDPARIHGLTDAAEALRRIAKSGAPLVVSDDIRIRYILETLLAASGLHGGSWYEQTHLNGTQLLAHAKARKAYTMWGDVPPLTGRSGLQRMVVADPVLQREIVAVVVDPAKVPGVNATGAQAFLHHLLAPATQARIRNYRAHPGDPEYWWPMGVANDTSVLPIGT